MNDYFETLVSDLSIDEMLILSYLADKQADTMYKSVIKNVIREEVKLTMAKFRNALLRLETIKFIKVDTRSKSHKVYITEYGDIALKIQIKKEEY